MEHNYSLLSLTTAFTMMDIHAHYILSDTRGWIARVSCLYEEEDISTNYFIHHYPNLDLARFKYVSYLKDTLNLYL